MPKPKHKNVKTYTLPSPTAASAVAPSRPTNSVPASVMKLYDSIETLIGHASRTSSGNGLCFQGSSLNRCMTRSPK
jgi:hypothetical protein